MDPVNVKAKFVGHSFTRSWDNSGYLKTWQSLYSLYAVQGRPRSLILVPIKSAHMTSY